MRSALSSGTEIEVVRPDVPPADGVGVVVIPDIFGMRPLFDDLANQLSTEHGWPVIVIDPFPGMGLGPDVDERFTAMAAMDDTRVLGDVGLAAAELGTPKVGAIGFCMGGMYALKLAQAGHVDRTVAFYGMIHVPVAWQGGGQADPLECVRARATRTEVLAIIGGKDPYTPPEDVAALRACAGVTVAEYPDAEHGFVHDSTRPSHRPADASDAWSRAVGFLRS